MSPEEPPDGAAVDIVVCFIDLPVPFDEHVAEPVTDRVLFPVIDVSTCNDVVIHTGPTKRAAYVKLSYVVDAAQFSLAVVKTSPPMENHPPNTPKALYPDTVNWEVA